MRTMTFPPQCFSFLLNAFPFVCQEFTVKERERFQEVFPQTGSTNRLQIMCLMFVLSGVVSSERETLYSSKLLPLPTNKKRKLDDKKVNLG